MATITSYEPILTTTTPKGEKVVLTKRGALTGTETLVERRRFFEQLIPETWHRVACGTGKQKVDRRRGFNTARQDIIPMLVERLGASRLWLWAANANPATVCGSSLGREP